jgi:hypothetical protein
MISPAIVGETRIFLWNSATGVTGARPQRPAGTEQLEVLSHVPVRLEVARAVDELLLTVAVREAVAAEWELGKAALSNHQILIRRRIKTYGIRVSARSLG